MDDSDPWRNQEGVKVITVLDVILGGILIILYFYYGIVFMAGSETFPGGFSGTTIVFLSFIFALAAISINTLQVFIAIKLFQVLKQEERSAQDCIRQSKCWLKGAIFFVILLFIKFFFLYLFNFGDSNAFDYVLCCLELLLRAVGLYCVKELIDDLKAESARGMPRSISVVLMSDLLKSGQAEEIK